jgi:hypothetical protein
MLSKQEIGDVLGNELDAAIQAARSADGGRNELALAYYDGRLPTNDDDEGDRTRGAVSLDVADMVEAVYAQLAPAIEDVGGVEFEAMSAADEPDAQRETAIVRAMLMDGYLGTGGFVALTEAIKNALLMRKGVLALWIDRTETHTPEKWEAVPVAGLEQILQPTVPGQRVEKVDITPDDEAREASEAGDDEQFMRVSLTRVDVDKRLCMGAIAPEDYVTSSLLDRDANAARFCADRVVTTRAALMAQGFDEADVAKLKRHDPTNYELYIDRTQGASTARSDAAQTATETVEVWRCYAMLGETPTAVRAERYRVWFAREGRVVLGDPERVGRVCYSVGNVKIYPHRLDGVSLFDSMGEIQELKSRALRNWEENLHKVNRPRLGVDESLVNLADARDATIDVIRVKGPNGLQAIPTVDAGPSVAAFLAYCDQARSERGGASLDMQSSAMQMASNQTAQGIERQYSVKEQLAAVMARTFAETAIRGAYLVAHYLLRTQWGGMVSAKLSGEWAEVDPAKWRVRSGVTVRVGQSKTQRAEKSMALSQVMAWQTQAMQAGKAGVLTDDKKLFNAAFDWIGAQQLRQPERYITDPSSPGAQQAAQGQAQQQAAARTAQGDAARAALMLEKYKIDSGTLADMVAQLAKLGIEEAKLTQDTLAIDEAQAVAGASAGMAAQGAKGAEAAGAPTQPGEAS